ncbi:MAG: branched-chain amino acid aminotransferase, partial [Nitrospirae bacterium]
MIVYLNGSFLEKDRAKVSVFDRGFLYGDGVFETLRVYSGRAFRLRAHLERLKNGLKTLGIPCPDLRELETIIQSVIEKNSLKDAYLRLTVTRGLCKRGPIPKDCGPPTVFCFAEDFNGLPENLYLEGVKIGLSRRPQWRLPEESHVKGVSFLPNIIDRMSTTEGEFDLLYLTPEGFVSETTVCNIFFIKDNTLYTPSLECAPLAGITRETVMEIGRKKGLQTIEGRFKLSDLKEAEEVFLTNTLVEVLPVRQFQDVTFEIGPWTRKIMDGYRELVKQETSD